MMEQNMDAVGRASNTSALNQPFAPRSVPPTRAQRRANMKAQPRAVRQRLKIVQAEMRRRKRESNRG